jgi:hypothetical protein
MGQVPLLLVYCIVQMIEVAKANLRDNAAIMSFLKPNVTLF